MNINGAKQQFLEEITIFLETKNYKTFRKGKHNTMQYTTHTIKKKKPDLNCSSSPI